MRFRGIHGKLPKKNGTSEPRRNAAKTVGKQRGLSKVALAKKKTEVEKSYGFQETLKILRKKYGFQTAELAAR